MYKILLQFVIISILSNDCNAQADSANAPYMKPRTIQSFSIINAKDSTSFTEKNLKKNLNTVFVIFSPDCEFCQHETRDLLKNIEKFRNTQIIMITYMPYTMMKDFYIKYNLAAYPEIMVGRDDRFFFSRFFKLNMLPSTFVYDKKGNFKKSFRQRVDMDVLLNEL